VALASPKILLGHSDITSLQICLWQKFGWVTLYGPMVASTLAYGSGAPKGYDRDSLLRALTETKSGWLLDLKAQPIIPGTVEGVLLGGCLTLVETTLGTPWELDTHGAILVLEDRGMKPYQVDRALMHLKQAGKFRAVAGIILGDFPECEAPAGSESVKDVAHRILAPLGVPVVWGAPVGHTERPCSHCRWAFAPISRFQERRTTKRSSKFSNQRVRREAALGILYDRSTPGRAGERSIRRR
jgi:muramoyltetrapeptide carboxypeptidase